VSVGATPPCATDDVDGSSYAEACSAFTDREALE